MTTVLERLRAALAPEYEVERELGSGGMGTVFLGRDTALDRPVAIKILRPELASAQGTERFLREARLLAKVKHPHIVPIHHVGERQGLSFYVMAHLAGETLAGRLAQGPLPVREAVQLCRNLLSALEAAHEQGVVHRDIKPDNIIIERGRAVLTDFGIAKSLSDPAPELTEPGQAVGTLEYMPPEQAGGGEVTPRTDLYAVAMVTYEAITRRPWSILTRPQDADWSGIPRRVARALRKALAWSPAERWKDATAFHRALWVPRPQRTIWPAAAVVAVAGVVVAVIALCGPLGICPKRRPQLMVEPFQVVGVTPPRLGTNLALIVSDNLARFPQIPLVPRNVALSGRPVHVAARVAGTVSQQGDTLEVRLEVRDSLGRRLHTAHLAGHAGAEVELADSIVLQVLRWLYPELPARYGPRPAWGLNAAALAEFLQGEDAFRRDGWSEAARHFREALRLDPSFARAAWRLANAQRWRRQPAGVDLGAVLARQSRFLMPLDSLLIAAELAPHGEPRYRIYRQALALYPNDPYARLLYGAELMHRGPLAGVPLDSGAAVLEEAVAQDPQLAPAHDQLVWALIRLGRREDARRALDRMDAMMQGHPPSSDFDIVAALEVAFAGRFRPDSMPPLPAEVRQDLARTLRFGLGFDAPALQLGLARQLLAAPADAAQRASAYEARGLALVGLGRPAEALTHFDSAAARFGTPAARLEASEWRVLPGALGVPGVPPAEVQRGRAALAAAARGRGPVAARAAWASGVDAYARRDSSAGRRWRERLRELATGTGPLERLGVLLDALDLAAQGDSAGALYRSATLLPFEEWRGLGDPFVRTVLHVRRADWLEGRSRPDSADRQLLWYENTDFDAWLTDTLQAAEVDWAFGAWARSRRSALSMARGDPAAGCPQLQRVVELWAGAEPPYEPLVREARRLREDCTR